MAPSVVCRRYGPGHNVAARSEELLEDGFGRQAWSLRHRPTGGRRTIERR